MKMTDEEKLLYLGNKLKSRRVELGMTRMDLDKKTGVSYQLIKVYEEGLCNPGFLNLDAICKGLDISLDELRIRE